MNEPIKAFWWEGKNFGDMISPVIMEHFLGKKVEWVNRENTNKLLGLGSIIHCVRSGDVIWGTGLNRDVEIALPPGVKVLALRGQITHQHLVGKNVPKNVVYGDIGILLPLIYNPKIEKKYKVGYLPHYVDRGLIPALKEGEIFIDIAQDWKKTVDEILSCDLIIASALHGIIGAEAYGIPVIWKKYSENVRGGDFKFDDYFLGTGRTVQFKDIVLPPLRDLAEKQQVLIDALKEFDE